MGRKHDLRKLLVARIQERRPFKEALHRHRWGRHRLHVLEGAEVLVKVLQDARRLRLALQHAGKSEWPPSQEPQASHNPASCKAEGEVPKSHCQVHLGRGLLIRRPAVVETNACELQDAQLRRLLENLGDMVPKPRRRLLCHPSLATGHRPERLVLLAVPIVDRPKCLHDALQHMEVVVGLEHHARNH